MKNALILLAGGSGKRIGNKTPKQFIDLEGTSLLDYFLSNLNKKIFTNIIIAASKNSRKKYLKNIKVKYKDHNIILCQSGSNRQDTTSYALNKLLIINPKNVLIHDVARPIVSNKLLKKIIKNLEKNISAIPYIIHNDLIIDKKTNVNFDKNQIINIQTPQGFRYKNILKAHNKQLNKNFRDDSSLLKDLGEKINYIKGEKANLKITFKDDIEYFKKIIKRNYRHGIGYDIHKIDFNSKKKLILCGLKISHPPLIGHSDADVGYHAICDSILGALSMKDIGFFFKNNNSKWKNKNSEFFMKFCYEKLTEKNYKIVNLDINFICEKPNINKLSSKMKKNISSILKIPISCISIKATTNEKIGLIGKGEGIAAESIIQIYN